MTRVILALLGVGLLVSVCVADEKPEIKDQKDKISYSLGYRVGGDFKRQGIEINPALIMQGIQDALTGAEPHMTTQEMRQIMMELKRKIVAKHRQERQQAAEKNLAEAKAFLAENGKKDGVKTLPSGLQYTVLEAGSGKTPKAGDTVTVHYRGTLINGTEFDSSRKRNHPATFQVDRVIHGWTEALQLMQEGAKWQLFIPPDLAYGERGAGAKIPPNSALIFEVELLSVQAAK
jgi:FKBP-type peptidyl-prolyl cis-trans isomerase FklB